MESLADFIAAVPTASKACDLAVLIQKHVERTHAPWSEELPRDLAAVLWHVRTFPIKTFALLGTGHGYTFFVIHELLKTVCPGVRGLTLDERNTVITDVLPFVKPHRMLHSSAMVHDRHFDAVFINGRSTFSDVLKDYATVGAHATMCIFFDAVGTWWWAELKKKGRQVHEYGDSAILIH